MNTINKFLLWSVQSNAPASVSATKDTPEKKNAFTGKLLAVTNVVASLEQSRGIAFSAPGKGIFSQSFQRGAILPKDNSAPTGRERLMVEGQKRLDKIIHILLPEAETSYQLARSVYENVNPENKAAVDQAKQTVINATTQKMHLQNEAIATFYQTSARLNDPHISHSAGHNASSDYSPLFSLIFALSSSFEDVETLLEHTTTRTAFSEFAANTHNERKVSELFQILGSNSRRSLENEIMLTLDAEE